MSETGTRISWTAEENAAVARAALARYGYDKWKIAPMVAVKTVQASVLAPDRLRKHITGFQHLRGFMPTLERLRALGAPTAKATPPASLTTDVMEPAKPPIATAQPDAGELYVAESEGAQVKDILSSFIADILVDATRKLLTNGEIARVLRSMAQGQAPTVIHEDRAPRHNPAPFPQIAKGNGRHILLCGFKPHQQAAFMQAFPGTHLKFWYAERPNEGLGVLKEKATGADVVLFTMEATSHSAVAVVQALGRKIVRVTGGSTAMMTALASLKEQTA